MIERWWRQQSERERRFIKIGGIILLGMLGYLFFYSPLMTRVTLLAEEAQSQQALLVWMQQSSERILRLKKEGYVFTEPKNQSMMSFVQQTLIQQKLMSYIQQTQMLPPDQMVITFNQVPFDALMGCLDILTHQFHFYVVKAEIKPSSSAGTVAASVVIHVG